MLSHHLIEPLPNSAAVKSTLALLGPFERSRVQTPQGVAGLPVFNELTLACYDKTQISQPPATVNDLLALAASGRPVGLSVDPIGIWWTAGTLGAQDEMVPLIVGRQGHTSGSLQQDRQSLRRWLLGLRQMALQSRVDVGSGPQELVDGLESGRLSWIPCYSATLPRLDRLMGDRLGVAPLPSGPNGPPSPFSSLRVWALGVDSSEEQRQLALSLAQLSLNPLLQRIITLSSRTVLPANRFVQVPVASSGRLAALAQAQLQFNQGTPLLAMAFSADRVQLVLPTIENVISQVMVGVITPTQGSEILLRLRPPVSPNR